MSKKLNGVTILQKGQHDLITVYIAETREEKTVIVDSEGGLKRCGGQGDILSGLTGTMLAWGKNYEQGVYGYACACNCKILIAQSIFPPLPET